MLKFIESVTLRRPVTTLTTFLWGLVFYGIWYTGNEASHEATMLIVPETQKSLFLILGGLGTSLIFLFHSLWKFAYVELTD